MKSRGLTAYLIAPCGMNCGLCIGYQRTKNKCTGCLIDDFQKSNYCVNCSIKNCRELKGKYCFDCGSFPCKRLKNLDKRYRTKYGMSMIENLNKIKDNGIRKFVHSEKEKWACPLCGNIISVHRNNCLVCGAVRVP